MDASLRWHDGYWWFSDSRLLIVNGLKPDIALSTSRIGYYVKLMLLIVGTVRLPAENLADARPVMKRMVDASRAEDGCLEYGYAQDIFDRGLIHVKELWADQASLDRHFASGHIAEWRATWPSLGIGDRDLCIYDVGEPRRT